MILRQNVGMIPGGVRYQDPRTPKAHWTDDHTFLGDRVREVIMFRRANPLIYPEPEWLDTLFVTKQVTEYNCIRLGNDPQFCIEPTPSAAMATVAKISRTCPDCGDPMLEKLCPTCSGQKVIGYRCGKCGKETEK